jgi:hypothetical protein
MSEKTNGLSEFSRRIQKSTSIKKPTSRLNVKVLQEIKRQRVSSYRPFKRTFVGLRWPPCCRTTLVERTRSNHKMVPTIRQPSSRIWMTTLCLDRTDSHNLLCDGMIRGAETRIKIYKLVHCYLVFILLYYN